MGQTRYRQTSGFTASIALSSGFEWRRGDRSLAQFCAGFGERHKAKFIDDENLVCGYLLLEPEQSPLVTGLHNLADQRGRSGEADGHALLPYCQAKTDSHMGFACELMDSSCNSGRKIASMCRLLWISLAESSTGELLKARSNEFLIQTLMVTLLESVPHRYSSLMSCRTSTPVPRHVKRAIDFMVSEIGRSPTVEEIAAAACVSVRTLQLAFQEFKDTTPLTYLKQLRLEGVRRDLEARGEQHELIADIAKRWGFTSMGRFASLYRQAFGESPRFKA